MAGLRCAIAANIQQCKAEAEAREACRIAANSGCCGEVEVCIPDRCRPGAAIQGIFRTLFGTVNCGNAAVCCEAAPACGCAAPVEAVQPTPAPAAEETTEAEAVEAEAVEAEAVESNAEEAAQGELPVLEENEETDSILPEIEPSSVSANYNPSNSIVLR